MKSALDRPIARRSIAKPRPIRLGRILVTTDFSRPSLAAIPYALAVARHFGAELHLLHVVDTTQFSSKSLMLPLISPAELSRPLLNRLQGIALKFSPDGEIHVMKPREGALTMKFARRAKTKRRSDRDCDPRIYGIPAFMARQHGRRVVQHSPCPVLVVRQRGRRLQEGKIRLRKILVLLDFSDCSRVAFDCGVTLAPEFHAELLLTHGTRSVLLSIRR